VLWSIAAGPLVNLVLIPVSVAAIAVLGILGETSASWAALDEVGKIVITLAGINFVLFAFNMLPIYPLDGGQILQALLWFVVGRATSLRIAASIGVGVAVVAGLACLVSGQVWLFVIAMFVGWQAFNGLRLARAMAYAEQHGMTLEDLVELQQRRMEIQRRIDEADEPGSNPPR
jgi:stage IV sporulation protein FB